MTLGFPSHRFFTSESKLCKYLKPGGKNVLSGYIFIGLLIEDLNQNFEIKPLKFYLHLYLQKKAVKPFVAENQVKAYREQDSPDSVISSVFLSERNIKALTSCCIYLKSFPLPKTVCREILNIRLTSIY